ncbi:hypothetical protein PZA11_000827 [Diplocarpon coronariae]|uniref:Uncharacterized protein n=1 Tax=Diplocarpon coronariae TaxID=2795749 RepID=A0A218Z497_9HELO|nr:hypothetical protein JHW43_005214 [Diplocarpon mali]OWP02534.1 hypothetical protein B2J93_4377 [Marssonina coronariae]
MAPSLEYAFTISAAIAPAQNFGTTFAGFRRFVPITGGTVEGPRLNGTVTAGGGDWNSVRSDGVLHILAKYTIELEDGTLINVHNEGYGRAGNKTFAFGGDAPTNATGGSGKGWYAKTYPRFEVAPGPHEWLNQYSFIGDMLQPTSQDYAVIEVYGVF